MSAPPDTSAAGSMFRPIMPRHGECPQPGAIKTYGLEARSDMRNKVTPFLFEVLGR